MSTLINEDPELSSKHLGALEFTLNSWHISWKSVHQVKRY